MVVLPTFNGVNSADIVRIVEVVGMGWLWVGWDELIELTLLILVCAGGIALQYRDSGTPTRISEDDEQASSQK
jgi:hypothetical protein